MKPVPLQAALVFAFAVKAASAVTIASTDFSTSLDGWTTSPGDQWILSYSASGGSPGSYARGDDRAGVPSYFSAPAKYLGDWTAFDGNGVLNWDTATIALGPTPSVYSSPPLLRISGPGGAAVIQLSLSTLPTPGEWIHHSVAIAESAWQIESGTWTGLIANVSRLQINGEFVFNGNPPGAEVWGLDNVVLSAAPEAPPAAMLTLGLLLLAARRVGVLRRITPG